MIEPKIDDLLAAVDSKYSLVILSAKRAREIKPRRAPMFVDERSGDERHAAKINCA